MDGAAYVGQTVGQIRSALKADLNIADESTARVGQRKVTNRYILKKGEALEFSRRAGSHG